MGFLSSIWLKHKPHEEVAALCVPAKPEAKAESCEHRRFIARQPIFDVRKKVFSYELLARSGWENRFTGDSDAATRKMIFDGALYGFQGLTGGRPAFINCTRESLVEGLVTLLPPGTVLEVLETIEPDAEVVEACRKFKKMGYQIALDDFRLSPGIEALVELADYIKVDFRLSDKEERRRILALVKGSKATLIAEKVETEEEYKTAAREGFDLFQGYFFCHPTVFSSSRAPGNGGNYLQLFSAVSQKELNFRHLTELVEAEVTICYQLLRLVNSAAYGLNLTVTSVHNALVIVGEEQFRKLVLNTIAVETCKRHPDALLIRVLHRARFLELMSPYTGENRQEQYMFGLLTLMGVMLGMPLEEAIQAMPLRDEVKRGLRGEANNVTAALRLLERFEEGDWVSCLAQCELLKISENQLALIYEEATQWAEQSASTKDQPPQ